MGWIAPPTSPRDPSRGQDAASHLGSPAALGAGDALAAPAASRSRGATRASGNLAREPWGPAGLRPLPGLLPPPGRGLGHASPQPLAGGACESTLPAARGAECMPGALGSATPCPPPGGSAWAAAAGLRGRPGTGGPAAPKSPVPLEAVPGPRRSCPCHGPLAPDAAASRWGRWAAGYGRDVRARGLRPAATGTPGVRAVVPLPAEQPGKGHLRSAPWESRKLHWSCHYASSPLQLGDGSTAPEHGEFWDFAGSKGGRGPNCPRRVGRTRPQRRAWGVGGGGAGGNDFWVGATVMTGLEWPRGDRWEEVGEESQVTRIVAVAGRCAGHVAWAQRRECRADETKEGTLRDWKGNQPGVPAPSFLQSLCKYCGCPWGGRGCRDIRWHALCFTPRLWSIYYTNKIVKEWNDAKSESWFRIYIKTLGDGLQGKTFIFVNMEIPNVSIYIALVKGKLRGKFAPQMVMLWGGGVGEMVEIKELIIGLK